RYAEAEPLYKRALTIDEKALGQEHPDVAIALNNLAMLYVRRGRNAEADPFFKRAIAIDEKGLGPDHPSTKNGRENLRLMEEKVTGTHGGPSDARRRTHNRQSGDGGKGR